jgi:DNA anti-recombination protein RmuC
MEALLERGTDVENWNDERLDELSRRMDAGFEKTATKVELTAFKDEMNLRFDHVDQRFGEMGLETSRRFDEVNGRLGEVGKRFDKIDAQLLHITDRLDRMSNSMLVGAFGVIAAVIANGIWG